MPLTTVTTFYDTPRPCTTRHDPSRLLHTYLAHPNFFIPWRPVYLRILQSCAIPPCARSRSPARRASRTSSCLPWMYCQRAHWRRAPLYPSGPSSAHAAPHSSHAPFAGKCAAPRRRLRTRNAPPARLAQRDRRPLRPLLQIPRPHLCTGARPAAGQPDGMQAADVAGPIAAGARTRIRRGAFGRA